MCSRDDAFGQASRGRTGEGSDRFRTLAETLDAGVFELDDEGRLVAVSDALVEMTGLQAAELLDADVSVLFDDADAERVERGLERLRASSDGGTETFEVAVSTASNERVHWELQVTVVADGESAERPVGVARDVTEHRRRERGREQYETIVEAVEDGVYVVDEDGRFTLVNDAYAEMLDYDAAELLGEHVSLVVGDDVVERARETEAAMLEGEAGDPVLVAELETADGDRVVAEASFALLPGDDPRYHRVGVVRDVTDRLERERALEESENRYRALAEQFPNGIVTLFDRDLEYTLAAGRGFDRVSFEPEDLEGRRVRDVLSEVGADDVVSSFRAALDGEQRVVELSMDGRDWVMHVVPVTDEDGEVFAGMTMALDITERKEQERELRKYETIIETVDEGIYVKDADGRFTMVNEAYAELTGYDREELVGEHASLVVDEEAIQASREVLSREASEGTVDADAADATDATDTADAADAADGADGSVDDAAVVDERDGDASVVDELDGDGTGPSPSKVEAELQTADGGSVPTEGSFSTLETGDGEAKEVGVVRDMTRWKEQRRRIAESERRYRTLVENFPDGAVALFDEDLRYTAAGGEFLDEMDAPVEDRVGERVSEIYPEELVEEVEPYFRAALDGEVNSFEVEYRGRVLFARTLPVGNGDDEVYGGMLVVQDITEQRERERELRQQRERLTALNNLHRVALEVNQALARQSSRAEIEAVVCEHLAAAESYEFGWVGEVDGDAVTASTATDDVATLEDVRVPVDGEDAGPTARAVRSGEMQVVEADALASGPLVAAGVAGDVEAAAVVPIAFEDAQYGVLTIYTSRTDAFNMEEREVVRQLGEIMGLAITAAERERALAHERERFELLNRLIRHNMLNTLNVVGARLDLLEGRVDDSVTEHLELVRDRTAEMTRLVETIRGLMRAIGNESHDLEPVDLGAVLEEQVAQARETYDDAVFEVDGDPAEPGPVMADELLGEVLENVLTNAVQHNDKDVPRVRVSVTSDAETTTVRVADNGPGVPDELESSLFEMGEMGFDSPGSGFGLYLVREIVHAYDGEIAIEDVEPEGTAFSISLPRAPAE